MSKKIRILVLCAAFTLVAAMASIGAYYTGTDVDTNTITIGDVDILVEEPSWDSSKAQNLVPGQNIAKDPDVYNSGENDAYAFIEVLIPKRDIYTYEPSNLMRTGERPDGTADTHMTELFQMNSSKRDYVGTHVVNSGWSFISSDTSGEEYNKYVYAYGSDSEMTKLSPGSSTQALFNSVTYCYAVEGQKLDEEESHIIINTYAIQADNLTGSDTKAPATVWNILNNSKE